MNRKHGKRNTYTYSSWKSAKERCFNKKHKSYFRYGGAGIIMCDEWKNSFEAFYEHMGDRPIGKVLDRIDGTKGYKPGNCRWASLSLNSFNSHKFKKLSHKRKYLPGVFKAGGHKFYARINLDEKRVNLGSFLTEKEAHNAYMKAKIQFLETHNLSKSGIGDEEGNQ